MNQRNLYEDGEKLAPDIVDDILKTFNGKSTEFILEIISDTIISHVGYIEQWATKHYLDKDDAYEIAVDYLTKKGIR